MGSYLSSLIGGSRGSPKMPLSTVHPIGPTKGQPFRGVVCIGIRLKYGDVDSAIIHSRCEETLPPVADALEAAYSG